MDQAHTIQDFKELDNHNLKELIMNNKLKGYTPVSKGRGQVPTKPLLKIMISI
jgi:hypothetical protein